jgi:hypothetical protein
MLNLEGGGLRRLIQQAQSVAHGCHPDCTVRDLPRSAFCPQVELLDSLGQFVSVVDCQCPSGDDRTRAPSVGGIAQEQVEGWCHAE